MITWFKYKNNDSSVEINTYKISYIMSCCITGNNVTFNLNDRQEVLVQAKNEFDAAAKAFSSKKITPYPHIYIDDIKKMSVI